MFKWLITVAVISQFGLCHRDSSESDTIHSVEHKLVTARKHIIIRLDQCTKWKGELEEERRDYLEHLLRKGQFEKFREFALSIAIKSHRKDMDCLKSLVYPIKKYARFLALKKRYLGQEDATKIEDFLSVRQLNELHEIYKETGHRNKIKHALERHFSGMPEEKIEQLIKEFFDYKTDLRRRGRRELQSVDSDEDEEPTSKEPEPLMESWLLWMSARQRNLINRMKSGQSTKWEILNKIGEMFYHQRKVVRKKYNRHFLEYCGGNLKKMIGSKNFLILENMFLDNDPVDQIETRFHEMIGDLRSESNRLLADHYGVFCRKVYRLVNFQPTDMLAWLTDDQKVELGKLIQNPHVNDSQVYGKVYEFFSQATGEQKEEADVVISTGCRHFIAHTFGDDHAEEMEEMQQSGNFSAQQMAAELQSFAKEISSTKDRKRAQQSLPVCKRIYLQYDGSCYCHGHASSCHPLHHRCLNCTDNTFGVQCETCLEGFTGDATSETGCVKIIMEQDEEEKCHCNGHSLTCKGEICTNCEHNTQGEKCDRCKNGFYGDATRGALDDCIRCPCPNNGHCFVNDNNLVQCVRCPEGSSGITCEKKDEKLEDLKEVAAGQQNKDSLFF